MVDIFSVIADHTRRELLQHLLTAYVSPSGEISVGELVELLGASQPTVSKQLKVLREAGLVSVREEGQHRYYSLDTTPLEELEDWLIPYLSADFDDDDLDSEANVLGATAENLVRSGMTIPGDPKAIGSAVGRRLADVAYRAQTVGDNVSEVAQTTAKRATEQAKKAQEKVREGFDWVTGLAKS
jgi:DNA-binding transcriptional ArsR family regulator